MSSFSRTHMIEHFSDLSEEQYPSKWQTLSLWDNGERPPFDRNVPNPGLDETLEKHHSDLGSATFDTSSSRRRPLALVPGCGRGYDVYLLRTYGYDAYGVDINDSAVSAAIEFGKTINPSGYYEATHAERGEGSANFVKGDFYDEKMEWTKEIPGAENGFDLIFDYTFLVAYPPPYRPQWAKQMASLLAKDGVLVCCEYPLDAALNGKYPPWGITAETYSELLKDPGVAIEYDEEGRPLITDREVKPHGLQRVKRFQQSESHNRTTSRDFISIWRRASS